MFKTICRAHAWVILACIGLAATSSDAAILYGDFSDIPPGIVMYTDVTESSLVEPTRLYDTPYAIGDLLDFDPKFKVEATPSDQAQTLDGQLNFTMMVTEDNAGDVAGGLTSISIDESGLYSFTRFPGSDANGLVTATLLAEVRILEVDGEPVPNPGDPIWKVVGVDTFTRTLADENQDVFADSWSNNLTIDFTDALASIDYNFGVTKAEVVIDNKLTALAQGNPNSIATIDKKDFYITPGTVIPEPHSVALMLGALVLAYGCRKVA